MMRTGGSIGECTIGVQYFARQVGICLGSRAIGLRFHPGGHAASNARATFLETGAASLAFDFPMIGNVSGPAPTMLGSS